jgi:hypothetical protein
MRSNVFNTTSGILFLKTAFIGKLNFETENSFYVTKSGQISEQVISNYSYAGNAKVILIPNKSIKMFVSADFFLPNISSAKGNLFLAYNFSFKPNKSNFNIRFIANNLTNTLTFKQFQVSDFSRRITTINTLPRNILLCLSFKF